MKVNNNDCLISPIFYMGNKKKLIKKGLIDLFPNDINTFYDLFGGSGIVSINTEANKYVLNDINKHLYELYNLFKHNKAEDIIKKINYNVEKYSLAKEGTKRNEYKDLKKIEEYKKAFLKLRSDYNQDKDVFKFYTLMFYSFSQQFRFNSKDKFNMPCGNNFFSEKNKDYIIKSENFFKSENLNICNKSYLEFNNFNINDFLYLDPPYLNTTATYNENQAWNLKTEEQLYFFIKNLIQKNIRFGMSNIMSDILYKFCIKNKLNIHRFNNFSYNYAGNHKKVDEVYICNYKIIDTKNQAEFFKGEIK